MLVEAFFAHTATADIYTLNSLLKACANAGQIEREPSPSPIITFPSSPASPPLSIPPVLSLFESTAFPLRPESILLRRITAILAIVSATTAGPFCRGDIAPARKSCRPHQPNNTRYTTVVLLDFVLFSGCLIDPISRKIQYFMRGPGQHLETV